MCLPELPLLHPDAVLHGAYEAAQVAANAQVIDDPHVRLVVGGPLSSDGLVGAVLTRAYAEHGWCTAIRGREGGGSVENLPTHTFTTDQGDSDLKCPTEIAITDRREAEHSTVGFLPLCHYQNTDYSVFFGAQTTQKPNKYDDPDVTANAANSARLPYLMATSRFAQRSARPEKKYKKQEKG